MGLPSGEPWGSSRRASRGDGRQTPEGGERAVLGAERHRATQGSWARPTTQTHVAQVGVGEMFQLSTRSDSQTPLPWLECCPFGHSMPVVAPQSRQDRTGCRTTLAGTSPSAHGGGEVSRPLS